MWAARLYKTRSTANDAIARHRVKVNGQRVKPSRLVGVDDALSIEKGPYTFELTVRAIDDVRRGAPQAALLYTESETSLAAREAIRMRRRLDREARLGIAGGGRPTKRQRREILRLQDGDGTSGTDR